MIDRWSRLSSGEASLDAPVGDSEGRSVSRVDLMPSTTTGPDSAFESQEMDRLVRQRLDRFRETLTGKDVIIFDKRMFTGNEEPVTPASLVEIERRQGYRFLDVDELGSRDPRFMTLERYVNAPDTADAACAFRYHVIYCKEYYGGQGYTLDGQGNTGVAEYIMPNRPLEELGAHVVIPVDVAIP